MTEPQPDTDTPTDTPTDTAQRLAASEAGTEPKIAPGEVIPFRQAVKAWFLISLQTFGGPAGQIAVMQRTLVEEKRWIGQRRFLHALNYCMLLPGPEAQQLAIYTGWLLNGRRGGLAAGTLFVLPGMRRPARPLRPLRRLRRHPADHRTVPRPRPRGDRHRHPSTDPGQPPRPHPPQPDRSRRRRVPRLDSVRGAVPRRGARLRADRFGPGPDLAGHHRPPAKEGRRRRPRPADQRRSPAPGPAQPPPRRSHPGRRPDRLGPAHRRGRCSRSAGAASLSTKACSSPAPPWSPSAAPTPSWPTSPNRRSTSTAGCCPAKWPAGSHWPKPPPAR